MGLLDRLKAALSTRRDEPAAPLPAPAAHAAPLATTAASAQALVETAPTDASLVDTEVELARAAGNSALQAGDFVAALAQYDRMVALRQSLPAGHVNRGFALMNLGRLAESEAAFRRAQAIDPGSHETAYFLGNCLADQGRLDDAAHQYLQAVRSREEFAHAWLALAHVREQQGRLQDAVAALRKTVAFQPDIAGAWQGLARLALRTKDFTTSLEAAQRWLELEPNESYAHGMLADALRSVGRCDEALDAADRALALNSADPRLKLARGTALLALKRYEDSLSDLRDAVAGLPEAPEAPGALAAALSGVERHEEALALLDGVLARHPEEADALHNRAFALMNQLEFGAAVTFLGEALRRLPDNATLQFDLAVALLTLGRWEEGWRQYEWRLPAGQRDTGSASPRSPAWPRWRQGQPVDGKTVLLTAEQGLGDSIHFFRYVPLVLARGATVLVQMPARLHRLFPDLGPRCRLLASAPAANEADLQCPLLSLPHVLQLAEPLAMAAPYIVSNPTRREHWRRRVGGDGALRVGLVWAGNPDHPDDRRRSIPLELLRQASLALPGATFVSLQMDLRDSDLPAQAAWPELVLIGKEQADMADTAALIEELDAVISVDTSVAHVCGALGRPIWLLLSYCPDWRWNLATDHSAWYPSARLRRQAAPGQWAPVLAHVMAELAAMADRRQSDC